MSELTVLPVSALVARMKQAVSSIPLAGIWIQGEVSNLTKHRSGHYYFSIKDGQAELSCVMFRSYVARLSFSMEEGMSVLLQGEPNVYEQRGQLQFYVRQARPDGIGALYIELEKRRKRLESEGLFAPERKKPKPHGILDIAVITAKEGAALQDVRATIAKRWPMAKLTLYPALVQGKGAPASIVSALKQADDAGHQAILLVRGGGSFEDLFCFNDESIVRQLADMKTYTVSGVGHEVDVTLADLAADCRAATPTAAAQWITPDQADIFLWISQARAGMTADMNRLLDAQANRLMQLQSNPFLANPMDWVRRKELELDALLQAFSHCRSTYLSGQQAALSSLRLQLLAASPAALLEKDKLELAHGKELLLQSVVTFYQKKQEGLKQTCSLLDACSPLKILSRGYSMARVDGKLLTDAAQAPAGTRIQLQLMTGTILATSEGKE